MLICARRRFDQLPFEDHSVDIVVCALALSYVRDMAPVMAEFARALRPGGHLVISDAHIVLSYLRPMLPRRPGSDGIATLLPEYHRPLSAYLAAALPLGFEVRRCAEPNRPRAASGTYVMPATEESPTHVSWELLGRCPEAAATVLEDSPILVVWHFQLK